MSTYKLNGRYPDALPSFELDERDDSSEGQKSDRRIEQIDRESVGTEDPETQVDGSKAEQGHGRNRFGLKWIEKKFEESLILFLINDTSCQRIYFMKFEPIGKL